MSKTYAVTFELKSSMVTIYATVFAVATNTDEAKYIGKLDIQRTYAINAPGKVWKPENIDVIKEVSTRSIDGSRATSLSDNWRIEQVPLTYIIKEG